MRRPLTLPGCRAGFIRRIAVTLITLACLRASSSAGQPASPASVDAAAFDRLFLQGDQEFGRGEYLEAARTWARAAEQLPTTDADNRRGLYDLIAGAYEQAAAGGDRMVMTEAVRALDDYVVAFSAAHPEMPLASRGRIAHDRLRARLAELGRRLLPLSTSAPTPRAAAPEGPAPETPRSPSPTPTPRPWKGLAIGGGVTTGLGVAMLGTFIGGYLRTQKFERAIITLECPESFCPEFYEKGRRADVAAVFGLVAAPLFIGAGATMLGIAMVRRKASGHSLAPVFSPAMAGFVWHHRF